MNVGFWPNFRNMLKSKFSPAEAERLLHGFQALHDKWFQSLSLQDLDAIAKEVDAELEIAFEAPE